MLKVLLPVLTFVLIFISQLSYFKFTGLGCSVENADWLAIYLRNQEYYLGFSYAVSGAFSVFAFMKFNQCRGKAIGVGLGASVWAIALWSIGCFLAGCCGSPMWIVYANLFGISILKIPKWSIAIMSLVMVILGYLWLRRKMLKYCLRG